jgi:predicted ATPase/class 3 adenylate cyclase
VLNHHKEMRSDLPTGTVTFLFTDVEGSTRLLDELGTESFAEVLAHQRQVVRDASLARDGVEVDTQGDAVFVAFPTAPGALQAAAEIAARLADGPVRLRIGVHTGTPLLTAEGYVGIDVHRAARIAAAGHGGQVLVSASTVALAGADGLVDLGEHRFKDLGAPERVFQLGDAAFPPIRSLYRTNLPVPATPFLGREHELGEVLAVLQAPDVRLVTLTGPGGTGKTRLALQAAAEASDGFADGVWWVPLASLRDPALVTGAIAGSLDVVERPDEPLERTLRSSLTGKRALLLLDNAEHLLPDVASVVSDVLTTPGPTVLVTSRERLRIQPEHAVAVPALSEPDAVTLFTTRARQVDASFVGNDAVAELCRRLDALPLAIELAAARTAVFSPEQLLARLGERLDLLRGGRDADPRQATLRATIEWSHDLLDREEQALFRRLSVFVGGCRYDAAVEVAGADQDTLQSLLDKSLLRRRADVDGEPRYWLLETIREFASERLLEAEGEEDELLHRLGLHLAVFLEQAERHLRQGPDQRGWGDRVAADYDNLRVALRSALAAEPGLALRIVGRLTFFLWARGGFAEARAWTDEALRVGASEPAGVRAAALESAAAVAERQGDVAAAVRYASEAYEAYKAAGDRHGMASGLRERGKAAVAAGEREQARAIYEELASLAEELGDTWNRAVAINNLGDLALYDSDWNLTIELCGQSRVLRLELGDGWGAALALANVALAQLKLGLLAEAARNTCTALREAVDVDAAMIMNHTLELASLLMTARHQWQSAATLFGAADRLREDLDVRQDAFEGDERRAAESRVRAALLPDAYAAAFTLGHELSRDDAVALVLETLGDGDGDAASASID